MTEHERAEPRYVPACLDMTKIIPIVLNQVYTYQIEYVFQPPSFWSKINFSRKVRHRIKAEVIIILSDFQ